MGKPKTIPPCIPEGYRKLRPSENVRKGDQYYRDFNEWWPSSNAPGRQSSFVYIREVKKRKQRKQRKQRSTKANPTVSLRIYVGGRRKYAFSLTEDSARDAYERACGVALYLKNKFKLKIT